MIIDPKLVSDFEIVVGLVAPIGTDLKRVSRQLSDDLRVYGYDSETFSLSTLFADPTEKESLSYYESRMDACDAFRVRLDSGDAVAAMGISRVKQLRADAGSSRASRKAWIFRTIKHDKEVELLRQVYGSRFVLVGVHQSDRKRQKRLMSLPTDGMSKGELETKVADLMRRDQLDEDNPLGQRVREAFRLADYFIDLDKDLPSESSRMMGLLFGEPFITPSREEMAMYLAFSTSLRSADPGRQVGAVIASPSGEVLSTGSNEVPKAGGGEYWADDPEDGRDFAKGYDFNKRQTQRVFAETLEVLSTEGHLNEKLTAMTPRDRFAAVWGPSRPALKGTRLLSLIEFGRVVHAEMSALMHAARSPVSVLGATLYTTAFPCHMCMRLVVAAGVARVVYVDPYPKSLAPEMYEDSISSRPRDHRVTISAFRGVGWGVFVELFAATNRDRDDDGNFVAYDKLHARYRLAEPDPLLSADDLEGLVDLELEKRLDVSGAA